MAKAQRVQQVVQSSDTEAIQQGVVDTTGVITPEVSLTPNSDIKAVWLELAKIEMLGDKRKEYMSYVEEQLKAIDKHTKAAKESLVVIFKGLHDAGLACDVAGAMCPTVSGADQAHRNRISKRRGTLKNALTLAYPVYDFSISQGASGGKFLNTFIGDTDTRAGNTLYAQYQAIRAYFPDLQDITTADFKTAVKTGQTYSFDRVKPDMSELESELATMKAGFKAQFKE